MQYTITIGQHIGRKRKKLNVLLRNCGIAAFCMYMYDIGYDSYTFHKYIVYYNDKISNKYGENMYIRILGLEYGDYCL